MNHATTPTSNPPRLVTTPRPEIAHADAPPSPTVLDLVYVALASTLLVPAWEALSRLAARAGVHGEWHLVLHRDLITPWMGVAVPRVLAFAQTSAEHLGVTDHAAMINTGWVLELLTRRPPMLVTCGTVEALDALVREARAAGEAHLCLVGESLDAPTVSVDDLAAALAFARTRGRADAPVWLYELVDGERYRQLVLDGEGGWLAALDTTTAVTVCIHEVHGVAETRDPAIDTCDAEAELAAEREAV